MWRTICIWNLGLPCLSVSWLPESHHSNVLRGKRRNEFEESWWNLSHSETFGCSKQLWLCPGDGALGGSPVTIRRNSWSLMRVAKRNAQSSLCTATGSLLPELRGLPLLSTFYVPCWKGVEASGPGIPGSSWSGSWGCFSPNLDIHGVWWTP